MSFLISHLLSVYSFVVVVVVFVVIFFKLLVGLPYNFTVLALEGSVVS